MLTLSNNRCLELLDDHPQFESFLSTTNWKKFPGITSEKALLFIKTKVLVEGVPLNSAYAFMKYIRTWLENHQHGGKRSGAGRKKSHVEIRKITLSADANDITGARKYALSNNSTLQQMFRKWLTELAEKGQ